MNQLNFSFHKSHTLSLITLLSLSLWMLLFRAEEVKQRALHKERIEKSTQFVFNPNQLDELKDKFHEADVDGEVTLITFLITLVITLLIANLFECAWLYIRSI